MTLKIIGGTFKGRSLKSPLGPLTKPTTSLVRKTVFDICQGSIQGSCFLDLFACSGAMGIEAISRGASHATFIESDRKTAKTLKSNLLLFGLEEQTHLFVGDVFALIHSPSLQKEPFDIIYVDPPYPLTKAPQTPVPSLLQFLDTSPLLSSSGILFLEEGAPASSFSFSRLKHKSTRRLGETILQEFLF